MRFIVLLFIITISIVCLIAQVRFEDNGDGTVIDNGTGLVWQKCSSGQNELDCSGSSNTLNMQGALQYCRNLSLSGFSWRLPSVNELGSIVDHSVYFPSINTTIFPNTEIYGYYWSSTSNVGNPTSGWYVRFSDGVVGQMDKSTKYYVRCVADEP